MALRQLLYISLGARLLTILSQALVLKEQRGTSKVKTVAASCSVSDLYRAGNRRARD